MSQCDEITVVVQEPDVTQVVVEQAVVLPPIEIQVEGIQGPPGPKGETPEIATITNDEIDLII